MLFGLLACQSPALRQAQPPIDVHLVVHIDPLVRRGAEECQTPQVSSCGSFTPGPWEERVENLAWLSARWVETGRAMDLQWGPEMAHLLTEEPAHVQAMVEAFEEDGETEAEARVAAGIAQGQAAVREALDAGVAAQSVHVHTVLRDAGGGWGTGLLTNEGAHPCDAWAGDPLEEAPEPVVEAVVQYGAEGGSRMVRAFGVPLRSFTGAVPRVLANKIRALSDPDALDPQTARSFPAEWTPTLLGGAYSECMMRATGHPPFELYRSDDDQALLGGEGPLVHPGEPVVGNMADHLDLPGEGLPGATMRRLLQAMLAWRYDSLRGAPARPWAYSFHTHLFHLYPGAVPALDPGARDVNAGVGGSYRRDLETVASFVDAFAQGPWQGLGSTVGGGPLRWALPTLESEVEPTFSYGSADAPPPAELDADYPYLPLLAERLDEASLVCRGALDGVQLFGLLRCPSGWAWGGERPGFHCAEAEDPAPVYLLVPEASACLDLGGAAVRAAPVSAASLGGPSPCEKGIRVPVEGLLVEPLSTAPRLAGACTEALGPPVEG